MQPRRKRAAPMPRAFSRLLVAWFVSVTGDGMRFAALPLLALTLSPSPAAVAAVAAATTLPWLLIALPAGALVDRLDPAAVIAFANAGRALATALLVVAVLTGQAPIALLCAVGFTLTAGETFADSAGQSLLVRIVPPQQLETANARFVSSENIGLDLIGPLAAGALFVLAHWLPFAIAAGIFLATAGWVLGLRGDRAADIRTNLAVDGAATAEVTADGAASTDTALPEPTFDGRSASAGSPRSEFGDTPTGPRPAGAQSARRESVRVGSELVDSASAEPPTAGAGAGQHLSVWAGFRVIFFDSALRALVITVAIMSAAIAAAEGVLVVYSASALHLSQALYPTLLACYSVGLLLAAGAVARWGTGMPAGAMMTAAVAVIGVTLLVMGLFPHPVVAWCSFLAMGAAGGVWNVLSASRRQRRTPPSMIARVSSTFRAIAWGALPLGSAIGGLIGQARSVPTVFVVSGLVVLTLAAVAGRYLIRGADGDPTVPRQGRHRRSTPPAPPNRFDVVSTPGAL